MSHSQIPAVWKNHPELRTGEVFLTNASDNPGGHPDDPRSDWEVIGWQTKRRGNVAYNRKGKPIRDMFPIFVQRQELKKAGVDPNALFK